MGAFGSTRKVIGKGKPKRARSWRYGVRPWRQGIRPFREGASNKPRTDEGNKSQGQRQGTEHTEEKLGGAG